VFLIPIKSFNVEVIGSRLYDCFTIKPLLTGLNEGLLNRNFIKLYLTDKKQKNFTMQKHTRKLLEARNASKKPIVYKR